VTILEPTDEKSHKIALLLGANRGVARNSFASSRRSPFAVETRSLAALSTANGDLAR
jgi:hypothetical protein